jgi:hypothetical protein
MCGAVVYFDNGARVSKVSLPSDFSAVRINGLPLGSTPRSVGKILSVLGFDLPIDCIRVTRQEGSNCMSADVRAEDPTFATMLSKQVDSIRVMDPQYSQLETIPVIPNIPSESAASRVDCKKVLCSWHKSTCSASLNFGRGDIARRVRDKFCSGEYKILGRNVQCDPSSYIGGMHNPVLPWSVLLEGLPGTTVKEDITRAIKQIYDRPRHIELGKPNYQTTEEEASSSVKAMLLKIGPLSSWESSSNWGEKRMKARAQFLHAADARKAVMQLDKKPLPFSKHGSLFVQLITSTKFKVPTYIYNSVRQRIDAENRNWRAQHVVLRVYEPTEASCWYTTIKLEGAVVKDVADAKNTLERILAGTVATEGGVPMWSDSFSSRQVYSRWKEIEKDLGVIIVSNKKRKQLNLYGPPDKFEEAKQRLCTIIGADTSTVSYIDIDPHTHWATSFRKFAQITAVLGKNVAAMDMVSTPKRIIITGSVRDFKAALAIYNGKRSLREAEAEKTRDNAEDSTLCSCCWTEAEDPIRTLCKHLYCLECFNRLCLSGSHGEKSFIIRCVGDMDQCKTAFSLRELQDHLSSSSFEEVLQKSFDSYVSGHPGDFHHCPSPDCNQVYRIVSNRIGAGPIVHICSKCCAAICMSCHTNHDGMTCSEYKYKASGEYKAFEKLKEEKGFKDCPKCKTTMEKTEGCNHMTCPGCKVHICWVCLETFSTPDPCYTHMNAKHGGIGLNIF